jgi:hypothetical protein
VVPALERLRQENLKCQASLGYTVSETLSQKTKQKIGSSLHLQRTIDSGLVLKVDAGDPLKWEDPASHPSSFSKPRSHPHLQCPSSPVSHIADHVGAKPFPHTNASAALRSASRCIEESHRKWAGGKASASSSHRGGTIWCELPGLGGLGVRLLLPPTWRSQAEAQDGVKRGQRAEGGES